jgi:hypothetical protein
MLFSRIKFIRQIFYFISKYFSVLRVLLRLFSLLYGKKKYHATTMQ